MIGHLISAAVEAAIDPDREWAVQRPNRDEALDAIDALKDTHVRRPDEVT